MIDWATLLASLGSSAIASAGSFATNLQNIKYAKQINDESVDLANTAHQREVRDLLAAGLNPILSASASGSSTPQLKTPGLENPLANVTGSAQSVAKALNGQTKATTASMENQAGILANDLMLSNDTLASSKKAINSANELESIENDLAVIEGKARLANFGYYDLDHLELYGNKTFKNLRKAYKREVKNASRFGNMGWQTADRIMHMIPFVSGAANSASSVFRNVKSAGKPVFNRTTNFYQ